MNKNYIKMNNLLETKKRIFISLSLFSLRYSLAGMFWDRNVHAYEDLLDSYTDKTKQQVRNYFIKFNILYFLFLGFTIKYSSFSINNINILFMEIFKCN